MSYNLKKILAGSESRENKQKETIKQNNEKEEHEVRLQQLVNENLSDFVEICRDEFRKNSRQGSFIINLHGTGSEFNSYTKEHLPVWTENLVHPAIAQLNAEDGNRNHFSCKEKKYKYFDLEFVYSDSYKTEKEPLCFHSELCKNIDKHKRDEINATNAYQKKQEENARLSFPTIIKKMQEASERGENFIQYTAIASNHDYQYHKKWLKESEGGNDMIFWLERTNNLFSEQGSQYNLCWRRKNTLDYIVGTNLRDKYDELLV